MLGVTTYIIIGYLVLLVLDIFAFIYGKRHKKWPLFIVITSIMVIGFIVLACLWFNMPEANEPIVFERGSNEEYTYIIHNGKEYIPYSACSPYDRESFVGYVGEDKQDEIYTAKDYPEEDWLINYLSSGLMDDCVLLKEKSVTDIPEGLTSEYDWNN